MTSEILVQFSYKNVVVYVELYGQLHYYSFLAINHIKQHIAATRHIDINDIKLSIDYAVVVDTLYGNLCKN